MKKISKFICSYWKLHTLEIIDNGRTKNIIYKIAAIAFYFYEYITTNEVITYYNKI